MERNIAELLQQIRQVENEHNHFVDQYFQIKDQVQQALSNLNNEPSSSHLNVYHSFMTLSESLMKTIRSKRLALTKLICELHKRGVYLDDEDEDEHETSSSLDEGIDEQSFAVLDVSSRLASLNNSDNNDDAFDEHVL